MENKNIDNLIDVSNFIDEHSKEKCKRCFRQIPTNLSTWIYSYKLQEDIYQGDVVDRLDLVYNEINGDSLETRSFEDIPCILLSNTCDMNTKGKTREKYISVAPLYSYKEFVELKPVEYSISSWREFLYAVKENRITDILFLPAKNELDDSVVLLDRISSFDPKLLEFKLNKEKAKKILSLSQIGFYYFLIKLTHHFARSENKAEVVRI